MVTSMLSPDLSITLSMWLTGTHYYRCGLVVHTDIRRLQQIVPSLTTVYGWPVCSLGSVLSAALLPLLPAQRSSATAAALAQALQPYGAGPILCTDIDLLFEPALRLEPLRLLRDHSRQTTLVVLWPGAWVGSLLTYAVPAHAHYRAWNRTELPLNAVIPLI